MASLQLKNITKVFPGNVYAVKDFNLDIADKEFVVFVGPSGCGKSTTLRMIAGLDDITSGELYIDGVDVKNKQPKDRDIAMVFQSYALYPHMTVYKNMAFGLKLRHMEKSEIDKRIHDAAKILNIEEKLDRKPGALSGGERQRVALGRAIVREPKVFLMDEPLSNLDAKLRVQMRAEITKLHKRLQTTFIYVTHDQTEAMTMGTRIVVMNNGVMQQNDTPQNLFDNPANMFVATFIGTPQMNVIKAKLTPEAGKLYAKFEGGSIRIPDTTVRRVISDAYIGKDIYLGVRPEDVSDSPEDIAASPDTVISADIELTELMGSETYLYLSIPGVENNLVARVDPRTKSRAGDKISIMFNPDRLYMFDAESGVNILAPR